MGILWDSAEQWRKICSLLLLPQAAAMRIHQHAACPTWNSVDQWLERCLLLFLPHADQRRRRSTALPPVRRAALFLVRGRRPAANEQLVRRQRAASPALRVTCT